MLGALIDRIAFRPILGWATAWSFDRLRRWLENGHDPAVAARQSLIHGVARLTLAFVLAYHGLIPKLLGPHTDELRMLADAGFVEAQARFATQALGVAVTSPRYLGAAFNPVSLNVAVAALAVITLLVGRDLPTASTCSRRPASPPA